MIVVTGSTGHLGNVLVRELLARGKKVRVIIPSFDDSISIKGLEVEKVEGDVRDLDSLIKAFKGAELVFHLAGIVSILPGKVRLLQEVNVRGTHNVVEAALKSGISRLVYTSSVHAFVEPPQGTIINENLQLNPDKVSGEYAKSKVQATLEVLNGVKQGLDAVIVFPSGVIGPYDYQPSMMGQLFKDFATNRLKAYIDGAYNFVDVRDVARGQILACEKGRTGEAYILSGERITIYDLFLNLEKITGGKIPFIKLPTWLALTIASFSPLYYSLTKLKPRFTKYSIRVLKSNSLISCEKAHRELGYLPRPIRETIEDSIKWFKETGSL